MIETMAEPEVARTYSRIVVEIDDEPYRSLLRPRHIAELAADRKLFESLSEARAALPEIGRWQRDYDNRVVILLDLMFPDNQRSAEGGDFIREGIEFIRDLRRGALGVDPRTPIVVLSNAKNREAVASAEQAGANVFFEKTVDPESIKEQLGFYLGEEILERRVTCEVSEVDFGCWRVQIRLLSGERWILQRWIPMEVCPREARVAGSAFLWDTWRCFRDYQVQYLSRAGTIEDDDGREVKRLLHPDS
jgi:CheY-like chemotaxis protein